MQEVYVADAAGAYHQIDILDLRHTQYRDFDRGEYLEFKASYRVPVRGRPWLKMVENGHTIYRGAVASREGSTFHNAATGKTEGCLKIKCISIPQILKSRVPWGMMRWGAPPVVEGYSALTLAQVLSSDAPSQSAGTDQYVPGLIWMAHSYFPITSDSRTAGVWKWANWGSHPRTAGKDVYVGGHLCTEVGSLGDISGGTYRIYRDNDLYVYGAGVGDFGPVCIDNFKDTGLRLGNLDRSGDYLLTALDVSGDDDNYWQIIHDFLFDMGIYLRLRHVGDLTYLDGSINPWVRGSSSGGAFSIGPGDYISLKRTAPRDIPPNALICRGVGAGVSRVIYTESNLSERGPWIEQTFDVSEGRLSPKGRLEDIAAAEWGNVSEADFLSLETAIDYFRPGDWLDVELSPSEIAIAQISEISRDLSPLRKIRLGGKYASPAYAYLEKQASASVEAMRAGQAFGAQEATDNLGPATTGSISWTPTASSDRDTAEILVDLRATTPEDSDELGLSVTYTLTITNTTYPAGQVIAIIPHQPWGKDPIFEGLDITEWCALDGTEETLEIDVTDPTGTLSETLGYTITIRGIGRYGQTPIATMNLSGVVSSTLDGNYYIQSSWDRKYGTKPSGRARAFIKTGGTKYYGTMQNLVYGANPATFENEWLTNPATGSVWSQGDLDDLQVGVWLEVTAAPGGTKSGEVLCNLSNVAKPAYDFKLVLVSKNYVSISYSISMGDDGISVADVLRVELR